jgi:bifunctional non-homologous end joining protein LigD
MTTATVLDDRVTLYYREGGSDKVYQVAVERSGGGFAVNFAFGRRGSTLQSGSNTPQPVSYEEARKVYDRLVKDKAAEGYTRGDDGRPNPRAGMGAQATAGLAQLLNPINAAEAQRLVADDDWWAQEKLDGRRVLVQKRGAEVAGINRSGLLIGLPEPVLGAVRAIAADSCLLDGEAVGDVYHCFDLLEDRGVDARPSPYALRYDRVLDLVDSVCSDHLRFADTATTARAKVKMLDRLRTERREGAVFKHRGAPYTPGRPASGGSQLKLKFYATASRVVAGATAPAAASGSS